MAAGKNKIKGLTKKLPLKDAAKLALNERIEILEHSIDKYLKELTVESLHKVRIAVRRVRYNLEIFECCFDKKKFEKFYKKVEAIQDISGSRRDLDVLLQNIKMMESEGSVSSTSHITDAVQVKWNKISEKLTLELNKFIKSKSLKDFKKIIKI